MSAREADARYFRRLLRDLMYLNRDTEAVQLMLDALPNYVGARIEGDKDRD